MIIKCIEESYTVQYPYNNTSNSKPDYDKKELIAVKKAVGINDRGYISAAACAKWYMGRSSSSSVVYCNLWVSGPEDFYSGSGKAGGGGYCKQSGAFSAALKSTGILLLDETGCRFEVGGRGHTAVDSALKAIAYSYGLTGVTIV